LDKNVRSIKIRDGKDKDKKLSLVPDICPKLLKADNGHEKGVLDVTMSQSEKHIVSVGADRKII